MMTITCAARPDRVADVATPPIFDCELPMLSVIETASLRPQNK